MTVYQFQQDLGEEIETILSDMIFKDPKGGPAHMKAFAQDLPKRELTIKSDVQSEDFKVEENEVKPGDLMAEEEETENDENDPYPFCIVRVESGAVYSGAQLVRVILIFGIFDDALDNLGHQILLNVMHKVTERFIKDPTLKDMYQMDINEGCNWILGDEDKYPYFISGVEMVWNAYFVEREDMYA